MAISLHEKISFHVKILISINDINFHLNTVKTNFKLLISNLRAISTRSPYPTGDAVPWKNIITWLKTSHTKTTNMIILATKIIVTTKATITINH